ncbi:MAG: hypothetical protein J6A52_07600 [Bacilli bacterium]|nr:hypothetical protein [Bacilli bacterium]
MNNKVFIIVEVPLIEAKYEVYIPIGKKIHKVAAILSKAVSELSGGHYPIKKDAAIYSKQTGKAYNINLTVKDSDIRNGSEIILI